MTSLTFMSCYSEFFPEFPRHKDKFIFLPSVNSISFVDILPRIRLANICSFSFFPSPPSLPLNVRLTHISKVRNRVQVTQFLRSTAEEFTRELLKFNTLWSLWSTEVFQHDHHTNNKIHLYLHPLNNNSGNKPQSVPDKDSGLLD